MREKSEALDAQLLQEEEAEAKADEEKDRLVLPMFTVRSRLNSGKARNLGV